jgi:hypothetical protein
LLFLFFHPSQLSASCYSLPPCCPSPFPLLISLLLLPFAATHLPFSPLSPSFLPLLHHFPASFTLSSIFSSPISPGTFLLFFLPSLPSFFASHFPLSFFFSAASCPLSSISCHSCPLLFLTSSHFLAFPVSLSSYSGCLPFPDLFIHPFPAYFPVSPSPYPSTLFSRFLSLSVSPYLSLQVLPAFSLSPLSHYQCVPTFPFYFISSLTLSSFVPFPFLFLPLPFPVSLVCSLFFFPPSPYCNLLPRFSLPAIYPFHPVSAYN